MIKVCHVTSAHRSNDVRIFQKECTSLAQQEEFNVYLIAQGDNRNENGVQVIGVGENRGGRLRRMIKISNKVYKEALKINADIYHLHDPELLPYAVRLKKKGHIVVFDSHENYPKQIAEKKYLPVFIRSLVSKIYQIYETYVAKKIDAVIIPGTTNGKNPFDERCNKTILVDNCPIIDDRRGYIEHEPPRDDEQVKVCYAGGLNTERGTTKLTKACYRAGAKLILAGRFVSEDYKNELMNMKEASCIDYRGICDYDTVTQIYNESDIGAATLLKIGQYATMGNLPTKTYEYMQVGLPIIMTDTNYNKELIEKDDFAYLVDPDDEKATADVIRYISENYSEAVQKTKIAYDLIQTKYNWNLECQKIVELYYSLIK